MAETNDPQVTLREITVENLYEVLALNVTEAQRRYVAPNAKSIAEAHFHPEAWFRAIYLGEEPVGFLMLHDESLRPEPRQAGYYFLWRLMVDASYQGCGVGRRAVALLVEHVRTRPGATELLTSCHPGLHTPEGFYRKLGFLPTGRMIDNENELRLAL